MSPGSLRRYLSRLVNLEKIVLLAIVIGTLAARLRLIGLPLERDEGEYAYAAQLILQGIVPWSAGLIYNMKLPGTYMAYAGIMWLFGQSPSGIRLGLLITDAASTVLFWKLAVHALDQRTALIGCICLSIMLAGINVLGPMAHATHFVVFWMLAGLLILQWGIGPAHSIALGLSGLALGLSILMKQPGAIFALYGLAVLILHDWRIGIPFRRSLGRVIWLSAGVVAPYAITCAILYHSGVFATFWFWTFTYARAYAGEVNFSDAGLQLLRIWNCTKPAEWLLIFLSLLGMIQILRDLRRNPMAGCLLGFTAVSAIALSVDLQFRAHYFVMLLPAVAMQIAYLFSSSARPLLPVPRRFEKIGLLVLLSASLVQPIWQQWALWFVAPQYRVLQALYGSEADDFVEAAAAAGFLADHTMDSDRVLDFGDEPELFFYSHRHSATGYIYTYSLGEDQPFARSMQQQFIAEADSAHPKFVVYQADSVAFDTENERRLARWMQSFLSSHYALAAMIVMRDGRAVILQGPRMNQASAAASMYIFQRTG